LHQPYKRVTFIPMKQKPITDYIIQDSTGWDEAGDFGDVQLYNGVLQIDTPKHRKGDIIECTTFLFTKSIVQFYNKEGNVVEELSLKLSVC
jgi:hypothetical protein